MPHPTTKTAFAPLEYSDAERDAHFGATPPDGEWIWNTTLKAPQFSFQNAWHTLGVVGGSPSQGQLFSWSGSTSRLRPEGVLPYNRHGFQPADGHADSHVQSHDETDHTGGARAHALVFAFPDSDLAAEVLLPRPGYRILDKLPAPSAAANQRWTVWCETAGTGTNTFTLDSSTDPFAGSPTWTTRETIQLSTSKKVEDESIVWTYDPTTEGLRVNCTAVGATAPQYVVSVFEWD